MFLPCLILPVLPLFSYRLVVMVSCIGLVRPHTKAALGLILSSSGLLVFGLPFMFVTTPALLSKIVDEKYQVCASTCLPVHADCTRACVLACICALLVCPDTHPASMPCIAASRPSPVAPLSPATKLPPFSIADHFHRDSWLHGCGINQGTSQGIRRVFMTLGTIAGPLWAGAETLDQVRCHRPSTDASCTAVSLSNIPTHAHVPPPPPQPREDSPPSHPHSLARPHRPCFSA